MLITELKPKSDILSAIYGETAIIICEGCREVFFPDAEAAGICDELLDGGGVQIVAATDYICDPDNLLLQLQSNSDTVNAAETILVFSCGVGVQTVAEQFRNKRVFAACDTYPLPGDQGLTPLEYDCIECGECHLNNTGGICPVTSCAKSLVNGQCGGSKGGKCEVDKNMECGWERIYRKLEQLGRLDDFAHPVTIRSYNT